MLSNWKKNVKGLLLWLKKPQNGLTWNCFNL